MAEKGPAMRLRVRHRLHWEFDEPASMSIQALRLTPRDEAGLTICHWRIAGDRGGAMPGFEDGYGNTTLLLTRNLPHRGLSVTVDGEVELRPEPGSSGLEETLPPEVFRRETPLTAPDDAIRALAAGRPAPAALAATLRGMIAVDPLAAEAAAEVLAARKGSTTGLVHAFLAAMRAAGTPARMVCGYLWDGVNGEDAAEPHAWAEVWDGEGWVSIEVLRDAAPQAHIRLALGLDESEAGTARGIRRGPGAGHFAHSVRVDQA
jgi:transglutaminase-like putative cysteine protease